MANQSIIRKAKIHNEANSVFSIREEKIFANEKTNKRLISNMYKELNIKKTNIWIKKNGQKNQTDIFPKGKTHMADNHVKRYSTSLVIREIEIKTTMKYHLTSVRMAIIKKEHKQQILAKLRSKGNPCALLTGT